MRAHHIYGTYRVENFAPFELITNETSPRYIRGVSVAFTAVESRIQSL
jgi:hypothetical protein